MGIVHMDFISVDFEEETLPYFQLQTNVLKSTNDNRSEVAIPKLENPLSQKSKVKKRDLSNVFEIYTHCRRPFTT